MICIDELGEAGQGSGGVAVGIARRGCIPLAETACELMFQVIADRAEKAA
jgi:hypothetical protein